MVSDKVAYGLGLGLFTLVSGLWGVGLFSNSLVPKLYCAVGSFSAPLVPKCPDTELEKVQVVKPGVVVRSNVLQSLPNSDLEKSWVTTKVHPVEDLQSVDNVNMNGEDVNNRDGCKVNVHKEKLTLECVEENTAANERSLVF